MKRRKGNFLFLLLSILSLIGIIYLSGNVDPQKTLSFYGFNIPPVPLFIAIVFLFVFFITVFFLKNKRRALFAGLFVISYLLLAVFNLKHPFFIVLLGVFFVILDRFFS